MNVDGMLPFENLVADYVTETDNHVLYRVTPVFEDRNLVASGVQMEAWSVEDEGDGVCFNVYVYNVQPASPSTTPPARAGGRESCRRRLRASTRTPAVPTSSYEFP